MKKTNGCPKCYPPEIEIRANGSKSRQCGLKTPIVRRPKCISDVVLKPRALLQLHFRVVDLVRDSPGKSILARSTVLFGRRPEFFAVAKHSFWYWLRKCSQVSRMRIAFTRSSFGTSFATNVLSSVKSNLQKELLQ